MNHILSDFLSDTCNSLENLRRNNVYKEFYYHIKCENLEDFLSKDITQSVQYQNLYKHRNAELMCLVRQRPCPFRLRMNLPALSSGHGADNNRHLQKRRSLEPGRYGGKERL